MQNLNNFNEVNSDQILVQEENHIWIKEGSEKSGRQHIYKEHGKTFEKKELSKTSCV